MAEIATGDPEEALDIVQDSMLKLVEKYQHKTPDEWRFLFFKILQSKITDCYRRRKVRAIVSRFTERVNPKEDEMPAEELFSAPHSLQPENQHAMQIQLESLKRALGKLPLRQQQAFLLRAWEGFDVRDTAKAMSCSEGSVKTHYSRATRALREKLEDYS